MADLDVIRGKIPQRNNAYETPSYLFSHIPQNDQMLAVDRNVIHKAGAVDRIGSFAFDGIIEDTEGKTIGQDHFRPRSGIPVQTFRVYGSKLAEQCSDHAGLLRIDRLIPFVIEEVIIDPADIDITAMIPEHGAQSAHMVCLRMSHKPGIYDPAVLPEHRIKVLRIRFLSAIHDNDTPVTAADHSRQLLAYVSAILEKADLPAAKDRFLIKIIGLFMKVGCSPMDPDDHIVRRSKSRRRYELHTGQKCRCQYAKTQMLLH